LNVVADILGLNWTTVT